MKLKVHIYLHNDIVDWDMDQFDKEANKSHYRKAYCCCHGNLLELCKNNKNFSLGSLVYGIEEMCTTVTKGELRL